MGPWLESIRGILERSPTRAFPLSSLYRVLRKEGLAEGCSPEWLLCVIQERADLFRVIRTRRGPWSVAPLPTPQGPPPTMEDWPDGSVHGDPWVLCTVPPSPGSCHERDAVRRLQETLASVADALDDGSPEAVARWIKMTREGEAVFRAFRQEDSRDLRKAPDHHSPSESPPSRARPSPSVARRRSSFSSRRIPLSTSQPPGTRLR